MELMIGKRFIPELCFSKKFLNYISYQIPNWVEPGN